MAGTNLYWLILANIRSVFLVEGVGVRVRAPLLHGHLLPLGDVAGGLITVALTGISTIIRVRTIAVAIGCTGSVRIPVSVVIEGYSVGGFEDVE